MAEAKMTISISAEIHRGAAFERYARSIGADPCKLRRLLVLMTLRSAVPEWAPRVGSTFLAPARNAARVRAMRKGWRLPWGTR